MAPFGAGRKCWGTDINQERELALKDPSALDSQLVRILHWFPEFFVCVCGGGGARIKLQMPLLVTDFLLSLVTFTLLPMFPGIVSKINYLCLNPRLSFRRTHTKTLPNN